jgi:putative endonuclease
MDRIELGRRGEEEAAAFLLSRGWTIWGRNVRCGRQELDIIAVRDSVVAFVEVKTRRAGHFGHPLEAITPTKQREVAKAARAWMRGERLPPGALVRFDAVSVVFPNRGRPQVTHMPDAWRLD